MLTVEKLVAGYGKVKVLQEISLDVQEGQLVTLIGSNGAGKTTTLRALSGMIKPESGSIRIGGVDISGLYPQGAGAFTGRPSGVSGVVGGRQSDHGSLHPADRLAPER